MELVSFVIKLAHKSKYIIWMFTLHSFASLSQRCEMDQKNMEEEEEDLDANVVDVIA